jgi:hypothetical protein
MINRIKQFLNKMFKTKKAKNIHDYSWDEVIFFYNQPHINMQYPNQKEKILQLIADMRAHGYDKKLYASVSVSCLRLFKTSMKDAIFFDWQNEGMSITHGKITLLEHPKIEFCNALKSILNDLSKS